MNLNQKNRITSHEARHGIQPKETCGYDISDRIQRSVGSGEMPKQTSGFEVIDRIRKSLEILRESQNSLFCAIAPILLPDDRKECMQDVAGPNNLSNSELVNVLLDIDGVICGLVNDVNYKSNNVSL